MYILGINASHGDAAAAIIRDGYLIAAVEEELRIDFGDTDVLALSTLQAVVDECCQRL